MSMGAETNVSGFSVRYDMTQPTTASWRPSSTRRRSRRSRPSRPRRSSRRSASSRRSRGCCRRRSSARPTPASCAPATCSSLAQAIADRSTLGARRLGGRSATDVGVLRPGGLVNVRGAGRVYNGSYFVTRVHAHDHGRAATRSASRPAATPRPMTGAELYLEIA